MKNRAIISRIMKYLVLVSLGWGVGIILLMIIYLLPVEKMVEHVQKSSISFQSPDTQIITGYDSTRMDNYTTVLMLNMATYESDDPVLVQAMKGLRYHSEGQTDYEDGIDVLKGKRGQNTLGYERYWNGWLVILKPLLIFFEYRDIQFICSAFSLLGIVLVCIEMIYNGLKNYIPLFLGSNIIIMPITVSLCFDYCSIYYIMLFTCLILLRANRKQTYILKNQDILFLLSGMATSYLDFLTYPLITLGFLIVFSCLLQKNDKSRGKSLWQLGLNSISWGIGYLGMWFGKWLFATIILKHNIIKEAVLQILFRTSNEISDTGVIDSVSFRDALVRNISILVQPGILVSLIIMIILAMHLGGKHTEERIEGIKAISLILAGCIPVVWISLVVNHSYIHYWMTYRNLSVTVFAWGCVLTGSIRARKGAT